MKKITSETVLLSILSKRPVYMFEIGSALIESVSILVEQKNIAMSSRGGIKSISLQK